jgi:hypothetical protein
LLAFARAGSFDRTRIGGGTLDWLKGGASAGKTAQQAEIGLSELSKILSIGPAAVAGQP